MARYRHSSVAREGWGLIALAVLLGLALGWWQGVQWAVAPLLLAALLVYYFRDPPREIPSKPLGVVSPADGVVVTAGEGRDPFLRREDAKRVILRHALLGVHSLRSPTEGKVVERWSRRMERGFGRVTAFQIQTDEGDDIVWVLVGHFRFIRLDLQPGERVGQGERCGFTFLPLRLHLYLPTATRLLVQPGDQVTGGETVLAELVRRMSEEPVTELAHAVT